MGKAMVLVDSGFQEAELLYPYYRFQEAGYKVDLVGPKAKETYTGEYGYRITSDLAPEEVKIDEYDAIVIPGGRAPDRIEADVVRGRKVTSFAAVATDLKNAGAIWENSSVVVDGNLVTSRWPSDLPGFCREALKLLE